MAPLPLPAWLMRLRNQEGESGAARAGQAPEPKLRSDSRSGRDQPGCSTFNIAALKTHWHDDLCQNTCYILSRFAKDMVDGMPSKTAGTTDPKHSVERISADSFGRDSWPRT